MSQSTNILNLDVMMPEPRKVVWGGREHDVLPMTLEQFAYSMRLQAALHRAQFGEVSEEDLSVIYKILHAAIPTIPQEDFSRMPMPALTELLTFITGGVESEDEDEEYPEDELGEDLM